MSEPPASTSAGLPRDQAAGRPSPLDTLHHELGGRMVSFAGWCLPVQYPAGIVAEHTACRDGAAVFDVSHMGQVMIRGEGAAEAFERLVPGGIATLGLNRHRYTMFTMADGGVLDDLMVARVEDGLLVVVNAARREADLAHMRAALEPGFQIEELADRALIALQGPRAADVLGDLATEATGLAFMTSQEMTVGGIPCRVARSGYTGEDGFEISVAAADAEALARRLLASEGVSPAGLGARDSLRLEAGLCLYGQDLTTGTTPAEADLGWTIPKRRREARDFPGADVILRELAGGPARKLVGIRPEGRAPARAGTAIRAGTETVGTITSGGFGPTLQAPIAMGYVALAHATIGTRLDLAIRGKRHPAVVVALPFVPHRYKR